MKLSNRNNLVVVDIETSGVNPFLHDVLAIGFVPINPTRPSTAFYIRHDDIRWTEWARKGFEKYASEWDQKSVSPIQACDQIEKYLKQNFPDGPATPVGHNVGFDLAFLRKLAFLGGREQLANLSHRAVDTHTLLYLLHLAGRIPLGALNSDGAFQHFGIGVPEAVRHTALGDALATRELLICLLDEFPLENYLASSSRSNIV